MTTRFQFMQRALALATRGAGRVSPNPLVGCVIVREGVVVGEGWHHRLGGPHAEIEALRAAGSKAQGATAYVNLEPCSHHGRTPPCTRALIDAGISRLVYATADPHPLACGGASQLREAGIEVICGVAEDEARHLNRFFFHHVTHRQPYVIAKSAHSLDGRAATRTGQSQWITGVPARQRAHELRRAVDAIVVGAGTVISDDPSLTVRLSGEIADERQHPLRVVLDSRSRVPLRSRVLDPQLPGRTLVVTGEDCSRERERELRALGHQLWRIEPQAEPGIDLPALLTRLGLEGVQSVLIEGGPSVTGSFLDRHLVHEMWVFLAPLVIGGTAATAAIGGHGVAELADATMLERPVTEWLGRDLLIRGCIGGART